MKSKAVSERAWLLHRIAASPDITLRELVSELQGRGLRASDGSLWRFLRGEGISFKKARTPAGKIDLKRLAGVRAGRPIRPGSIPRA